MTRSATAVRYVLMMLCSVLAGFHAYGEQPIPSQLNASDIDAKYFGAWDLTFTIQALERDMTIVLNILDVDGKVAAMLDSANQSEPFAIPNIALVDGRLDMNSDLTFGGFTVSININSVLEGETLVGTVKDANGLLKEDFRSGKISAEKLAEIEAARPAATEARFNVGEKRVRVIAAELETGNSDWELFQKLQEGEVHAFTLSGATKMFTDFDLHFGETVIKTENVGEGYPGVYSLWLKKTGDGWKLVFNSQPDIWGSLRKPEHDVAEIPLATGKAPKPAEMYTVAIDRTSDGGVLRMAWGEYEWRAPFKIVQ